MLPNNNDERTPLVGSDSQEPAQQSSTMSALRQAQLLRQQRQSLNQSSTNAEPPVTSPVARFPALPEVVQPYNTSIQDGTSPHAMAAAQDMTQNNLDDHFQRADNLPAASDPQNSATMSPFDPPVGSDMPDWRLYGFHSEAQYQAAQQEATVHERLAPYRAQQQPPRQAADQQHAHPNLLDQLYGGGQDARGGDDAPPGHNSDNEEGAAGQPQRDMDRVRRQIQQDRASPLEKFKKQNRYELLKLHAFTASILLCLFLFPDVNKGCQFTSTKFIMVFFYMCVIPEKILRVMYQFLFASNEQDRMTFREFILKAIMGVLYASWLIYVLATFESFTAHCYDPYPSFSLAVFSVIVCFILPSAFFTICIVSIGLILSPCIGYQSYHSWRDANEQQNTRDNVVDNTPKVTYDKRRFWGITQCAICVDDFADGEEVTPLRCDMRHTFHTPCIVRWLQDKNICPVCRAYIDPADMRLQCEQIEGILDDRGRKYDAKLDKQSAGEDLDNAV